MLNFSSRFANITHRKNYHSQAIFYKHMLSLMVSKYSLDVTRVFPAIRFFLQVNCTSYDGARKGVSLGLRPLKDPFVMNKLANIKASRRIRWLHQLQLHHLPSAKDHPGISFEVNWHERRENRCTPVKIDFPVSHWCHLLSYTRVFGRLNGSRSQASRTAWGRLQRFRRLVTQYQGFLRSGSILG